MRVVKVLLKREVDRARPEVVEENKRTHTRAHTERVQANENATEDKKQMIKEKTRNERKASEKTYTRKERERKHSV